MPAVTTSSATGSRVLQKPVVISEAARTSQPSRSEEANTEKATAKFQQANSSKRSSTSSTMSSKVKRFPTLLSRKENRSKAETTDAANGNPRSASNGDTRRKSLGSSIRTGAPATPQSHNRSVSLASATPSSLPRPVASTGFPSSATVPNLAEANHLNGNPQQPPSPVGFNGSPKRVPPPGQDGTSGIPRLVTSPRSVGGDPAVRQSDHTPSEAPVRKDFTSDPDQLLPNASTGNEKSASDVREVIASGDAKDPTAGLPASNENVASARNDAQLYIADVQGSPDPGKTEVRASSDTMSRTSSGSRLPMAMAKTSVKNTATQSGSTSPDTSVPAMWRSNSYEGSAQAYITTSQSGRDIAATTTGPVESQVSPVSNTQHQSNGISTHSAIGVEGLRALEKQQAVIENPAAAHRVQLLHQLVVLRGEPVLTGVDVSQIVWLKGTDADISVEEEFSRARNGKALSQVGSPVVASTDADQSASSTYSSPKKHGLLDRVSARFGGGHSKSQQASDSNGSVSLADTTDRSPALGSPRSTAGSAAHESATSKRGPVFGTALQDIPPLAMAISIIGGQRHQLPILVFSLVEAIFKRGLDTSGIFRMNGNAAAVQRLVEVYNTWPSYGDDHITDEDTIFTLCEVLKKYLRDLPESLLGGSLWTVFVYGCLADRGLSAESEHYKRMAAVQIIFRLLPRKNMSLLIYLIAFLYQVSLRPANRLTIESISVIFGPSLLGTSRSEGQTSNGINSSKASAEGLRWLLENWEDSLSQDLLDEDYDCFASPFVGQTAWSTPNLLGEMQTDPLIQGNLQGEVQSTKDRDLPEVSHSSDAATGRDHSRSLPQEANTINSPLNNDPVKLNDGSQLLPEGASALEPASLPGDSNMPEGVKTASTNRSVSAFAKGERFSDEDINSDPNAAQLFGSLSQLFSTERRKAKVYQQQVEELQQQQQVHLSTISALQAELSGSHATIGRLQTELSDFESKLEQLQNESVRSTALHHQQQEALDATRKDLEHQKEQHASLLQQIEEDKARLHQQHAEAVRARDQEHESQMQEQARSLQEQHAKDESDRTNALSSSHRQELDRLQTEFDAEKGQLNDEIRRLREAVQVSDRERDGAREHLQRIRALLDAAQ